MAVLTNQSSLKPERGSTAKTKTQTTMANRNPGAAVFALGLAAGHDSRTQLTASQ